MLATKAGVGLRFVRELEQGKKTLRVDKVEQVLGLFESGLNPFKSQLDPFEVFWHYFNLPIVIETVNGQVKYGFILEEHFNPETNRIVAWSFLPNPLTRMYKETEDVKLLERIEHDSIRSVRFQNHLQ